MKSRKGSAAGEGGPTFPMDSAPLTVHPASMFAFLAAAAALATCPVESARYALRHTLGATAAFRPVDSGPDWPSGLALVVRTGGATSWWLPWDGGTNGQQNLASTTDVKAADWRPPNPDGGPRPQGDRRLLGFDAAYDVLERAPRRGDPAPAHLLVPDAGSSGDRVFAWKRMFDLVGCGPG